MTTPVAKALIMRDAAALTTRLREQVTAVLAAEPGSDREAQLVGALGTAVEVIDRLTERIAAEGAQDVTSVVTALRAYRAGHLTEAELRESCRLAALQMFAEQLASRRARRRETARS